MTAEMYAAEKLLSVLDRAREEITQYRFRRAGRLVHELSLMITITHEELRMARAAAAEEAPVGIRGRPRQVPAEACEADRRGTPANQS